MAVAVEGTPSSYGHDAASADFSTFSSSYTLDASAELLLMCVGIEGNEAPGTTDPARWDTGGTYVAGTLVSDSGSTGSNADMRTLVYGWINPDTGNRDFQFRVQFSADTLVLAMIGISGVDTSSVTAATNDLETVSNATATSTTVFASAGTSGNGLLAWGATQNDSVSASINAGFTEHLNFQSGTGAGDSEGFLGTLADNAPQGPTITWGGSDENAGNYIELVVPAAGGRTEFSGAARGVMRGVGRGI